jgi:hypothetical protein
MRCFFIARRRIGLRANYIGIDRRVAIDEEARRDRHFAIRTGLTRT